MIKYIGGTLIIILLILYIIIGRKQTDNASNYHFKQFNSASLNGELEYFDIAYKGVRFKLNANKIQYVFYPRRDLTENKVFDDIAEKGDIVVKTAYSDTLKLIKKGKVFLFPFRKFSASGSVQP